MAGDEFGEHRLHVIEVGLATKRGTCNQERVPDQSASPQRKSVSDRRIGFDTGGHDLGQHSVSTGNGKDV